MLILCDIDGTLAHMDGRRTAFQYDKVELDRFDPFVGYLLSMHYDMRDNIILISGREDTGRCRELTERWLMDKGVRYHELYMRAKNDFRADEVVKKEIWETRIMPGWAADPLSTLVYDDRIKVVKMWREELGLKVFQVAPGDFDKPKPLTLDKVNLVWNDPSPIEGNDYTIRSMNMDIDNDILSITYGPENGERSEAEVYAHEVLIYPVKP